MAKCERCTEYFSGNTYRVTSEDDGVVVLDMVVCYECYLEAAELGLDAKLTEIRRYAVH